MVTSVVGLLHGVLSPLPDAGSLGLGNFGPLFTMLGTLNQAIPVYEFGQMLAVYFAVQIAMAGYIVVRALWRFVPLVGGG
jgi:hypothetical protein